MRCRGERWIGRRVPALTAIALGLLAIAASPASAAIRCPVPGSSWEKISPEEAGMDAKPLQAAIDDGMLQESYSITVYRRGCLVAQDRLKSLTYEARSQSYSMAKSMTALSAMRAMTLGLLSPDDPVGSLIPEADAEHGTITVRQLLHMTAGLRWNFFRDYNLFMPDRIHEALTVEVEKEPGTYFEYSQSTPALLAEVVERAAGEDFQEFTQRELFGRVGIEPGTWHWGRDRQGATQGFFDLNMQPTDYARLGELMRRGGRWGKRRLLAEHLTREAVEPSPRNGCYGWMIWVNAGSPCVGSRVVSRTVVPSRSFPGLPRDMYYYSGLFGQIVAVFPSQELMVVRTGLEVPVGDTAWQNGMLAEILRSITDQEVKPEPDPDEQGGVSSADADRGILQALTEPQQFAGAYSREPLPPAGPPRARAALIEPGAAAADRNSALIPMDCPPRWTGALDRVCEGRARIEGGKPVRHRIRAGTSRVIRLPIRARDRRALQRGRSLKRFVVVRNGDASAGARARTVVTLGDGD
jgi:CubicO group peptidase (beta-lactamase class C family)